MHSAPTPDKDPPTEALGGGCLCGAIRYRLTSKPRATVVCHCTHCQRQSGSAFSVNLICAHDTYVQEGRTQVFEDHGDSGLSVLRHFCGNCGSPVRTEAASVPGHSIVKAGTLDRPWTLAAPGVEVYTHHAMPWLPRLGDTVCFAQARQ